MMDCTVKFVVWISRNGGVSYNYRNLEGIGQSINEYTRLKALSTAMLTHEQLMLFNRRLATALATAFRKCPGSETEKIFAPLEQLVHKTVENKIRVQYLLITTSIAALLTLILALYYFIWPATGKLAPMIVAACGGLIGTFLSISERSREISTSEYTSTELIILQGVLRVGLGAMFGVIAYLAAISGFAFSILSDTTAKIALLGIAAGFSERLIPDLVNGISTQKDL